MSISNPIPEPISIPNPEPIPNPNPELITIPEQIPEPIPASIAETDSGPTIRDRFQKTSSLAEIDSDKNLISPITNTLTHSRRR